MAGTSQSSEEKVEAVQFFECNICLETACNPVITQCGHLYWCVQNPESASHFTSRVAPFQTLTSCCPISRPCAVPLQLAVLVQGAHRAHWCLCLRSALSSLTARTLLAWLPQWMRASPNNAACPICKAALSEERIIPLYGRGRAEVDPRKDGSLRTRISDELDAVPARPRAPFSPSLQTQQAIRQQQQYQQQQQNATLSSGLRVLPSVLGLQLVFPMPGMPPLVPAMAMPSDAVAPTMALTAEQAQQAFLSRMLLLLGSLIIFCLLLF
jgi:E3 ubiquitin-protein ligase RNF5